MGIAATWMQVSGPRGPHLGRTDDVLSTWVPATHAAELPQGWQLGARGESWPGAGSWGHLE